jgi:hypothetical protein
VTATTESGAGGNQQRVELGAYVRDDAEHVVATRTQDSPWQLLDTTGDITSVIESFYRDEDLDAVRAVAELYAADRRCDA